jgi:hypothetical protein
MLSISPTIPKTKKTSKTKKPKNGLNALIRTIEEKAAKAAEAAATVAAENHVVATATSAAEAAENPEIDAVTSAAADAEFDSNADSTSETFTLEEHPIPETPSEFYKVSKGRAAFFVRTKANLKGPTGVINFLWDIYGISILATVSQPPRNSCHTVYMLADPKTLPHRSEMPDIFHELHRTFGGDFYEFDARFLRTKKAPATEIQAKKIDDRVSISSSSTSWADEMDEVDKKKRLAAHVEDDRVSVSSSDSSWAEVVKEKKLAKKNAETVNDHQAKIKGLKEKYESLLHENAALEKECDLNAKLLRKLTTPPGASVH